MVNGFPASVVSQLMSEFKMPSNGSVAAQPKVQFFDALLRAEVRHADAR